MSKTLVAVAAILLALGAPASAHRLDEYLQATIFSVDKDRVQASTRLAPGVAVSSSVISSIDTNGDGILSDSERQTYAERVLRDMMLRVDGHILKPRLASVNFPTTEEMKEGLGEIQIEFSADLPRGGSSRKLIFENHHQSRISAYLVNCLVPSDKNIQITAQNRNENQSFYELDYVQADARPDSRSSVRVSFDNFGGFPSMFRLGVRHIAEGTDHLLFLLALLLPAPLLISGSRWAGFAGVRHSTLQILKVVTAFTAGHSITLALAALGLVHVPSRPIEVLIAFSIFVSAAHALRPLFAGREAGIAAFFGLIHGLAFATILGELGLGRWERVAAILGFNLGIEAMQLVVVVATMPSLVLLSRTRTYSVLRIGGALFAGFASVGWIVERLLSVHSPANVVVDSVAHHAIWITGVLWVISLVYWSQVNVFGNKPREPISLPSES
jgi:hypothetical protein